jgi:hypothetical protein
LETYGKTPAQLENLSGLFVVALGGYTYETVKAAFMIHIRRSSKLPTPADIINIIDPPKEKLSGARYVAIMEKCTVGGHFLCGVDREFVEAYEAQELAKARGGSQEFRDALAQIESMKMKQLEAWND